MAAMPVPESMTKANRFGVRTWRLMYEWTEDAAVLLRAKHGPRGPQAKLWIPVNAKMKRAVKAARQWAFETRVVAKKYWGEGPIDLVASRHPEPKFAAHRPPELTETMGEHRIGRIRAPLLVPRPPPLWPMTCASCDLRPCTARPTKPSSPKTQETKRRTRSCAATQHATSTSMRWTCVASVACVASHSRHLRFASTSARPPQPQGHLCEDLPNHRLPLAHS